MLLLLGVGGVKKKGYSDYGGTGEKGYALKTLQCTQAQHLILSLCVALGHSACNTFGWALRMCVHSHTHQRAPP